MLDEDIELTPEIATEVMIDMSDPRSEHFGQMRHETLPADHLFGRRVELLTLAVLSQLRVHANFHRIAREWMYGEPPVTLSPRLALGTDWRGAWSPYAALTRLAWVGASGTSAGRFCASSLRSTGTTSPPRMSSCSSTVLSGRPAWSMRNSWRW